MAINDVKMEKPLSTHGSSTADTILRTNNGLKLEPQPSGKHDPLLWPMSKKILTLFIYCFCAFIGLAQSQASTSGVVVQAEIYTQSPTELSYGTAAAIVGLATGPIFALLVSYYIGQTSVMFWCLLVGLGGSIWSSTMTREGQYVPFVVSRWFGATFGCVGTAFGAGVVFDIFHLHQRGKTFTCYSTSILFGVIFGVTISGFIAGSAPWPAQYWWTIGAFGLCVLLVAFFLEDTTYNRSTQQRGNPAYPSPKTYLHRRLVLLFLGHRILSPSTVPRRPLDVILLAFQPVTLLSGAFSTITFGWSVAVVTLVPVFLQSPITQGGYGFSPISNACFTFVGWITALMAELYGLSFADKIPLWRCRRFGQGIWKAEYRLFPVLVPCMILLPIGLGIFGAGLEYHLPWEILALGFLLLNFCELAMTPVIANYLTESFFEYPSEVFVILQFYRLILGLVVPFFIQPWLGAVGAGWTFGMMGFFCFVGYACVGLLGWKGAVIRSWSARKFGRSEDGDRIFGNREGRKE